VLVQSASTWHALGSPELGLALIGGAEALLAPDDRRGQGWVLHLRASIQIDLGAFDEAQANLVAAARAYHGARRPYDRALSLVALARLEVERGDAAAALVAARRAERFAARERFARVSALATIQESRALLLESKSDRAVAALTRVLAETVATSDNVVRFYVHYYLSKAYASAGDSARSRVELEQAKYFVRFVDQASKETSEVRGHLGDGSFASST
jgi:ATP/maltotriose-dependent transcriptional regulator MalT